MKCPICGNEVINSHICYKCDTNAYVLNKIFNISVRLYNEALEKAKQNDFLTAIALLKKSLAFNKNNVQAINLLGLLYYQIGRLGDAVKQWILSSNINKDEKNRAFYYLEVFNKNIRAFEKLDNAVILYNEAITYLKKKNDDLAVIRLKKAIDINPNFIDALNLLAFCYIVQKKYKKCLKILNRVLALDKNNKIALDYLEKITKKSTKKRKKRLTEDDILSEEYTYNGMVKTLEDDDEEDKKTIGIGIKLFISCLFGVMLSALVMYFLVIPDFANKKQMELDAVNTKLEESTKSLLEKETIIQDMEKEKEKLQQQLKVYTDRESITNNFNKINIALDFYQKQDKEKAKSTLDSVDTTGFSQEQLNQYNKAKEKIK